MKVGIYSLICIDEYSATPKYLQISNCIVKAIEAGQIERDDTLPSLNDLSYELDISRDTAEKSYRYMKKIGVLGSVPGKGYFIKNTDVQASKRIFLLFNKLSAHKKILYDALVASLGDNIAIDFYIYNNDYALFKKLLSTRQDSYSHYIIIPHFNEGGEHAAELINSIPKDKLILLDKLVEGVEGQYGAVYENFHEDIYNALQEAREPLSKYHTLKIIFPSDSYYPDEILHGFRHFCQDYAFNYKIVDDISTEDIGEGEVYINVMEDDLVVLIERIGLLQLRIGEQVGIISYNETPLKKLILSGITTISTDFRKMGEMVAELVLSKQHRHEQVPFHLLLRPSL